MHVVWKRPDGFHGADPSDFTVINLSDHSKLWLHKRDHTWFPFRVSGGWQESEATQRLNSLVNLLDQPDQVWVDALVKLYNDTMGEDAARFIDDICLWMADLHGHLKGDTWELDIMNQALAEVEGRLKAVRTSFLAGSLP